MFIVLEWKFLSTFFFEKKNIPQKSDEHGWVFFSPKKKKSEKNTHACLMNMRGSLPLLEKLAATRRFQQSFEKVER